MLSVKVPLHGRGRRVQGSGGLFCVCIWRNGACVAERTTAQQPRLEHGQHHQPKTTITCKSFIHMSDKTCIVVTRTGSPCCSLRPSLLHFFLQFAIALCVFSVSSVRQFSHRLQECRGIEVAAVRRIEGVMVGSRRAVFAFVGRHSGKQIAILSLRSRLLQGCPRRFTLSFEKVRS